jgi:hypothetical protein
MVELYLHFSDEKMWSSEWLSVLLSDTQLLSDSLDVDICVHWKSEHKLDMSPSTHN